MFHDSVYGEIDNWLMSEMSTELNYQDSEDEKLDAGELRNFIVHNLTKSNPTDDLTRCNLPFNHIPVNHLPVNHLNYSDVDNLPDNFHKV
jgi:hypothetical protein